jgi:hypothetical protein
MGYTYRERDGESIYRFSVTVTVHLIVERRDDASEIA